MNICYVVILNSRENNLPVSTLATTTVTGELIFKLSPEDSVVILMVIL